jgi:hypothetical protein
MTDHSLPADPRSLFDEALRLATELDRAGLYTAAAFAAMAADAIWAAVREAGAARPTPLRTRRHFN